jgi:hypothetical protein
MSFRAFHHGLEIVCGVRELPPGIDVVRAGQDMHCLWLQADYISVETRGYRTRCLSNNAHIEPVVLREGSLLACPARIPAGGD